MKPKKPTRIKAKAMRGPTDQKPFLLLPIDNPDALVEQVANDLASYGRRGQYLQTWEEISSAALRHIGVPLKNK